jgi:hypothetical protein
MNLQHTKCFFFSGWVAILCLCCILVARGEILCMRPDSWVWIWDRESKDETMNKRFGLFM